MYRCIIRQASTFIYAYVVNMYMLDASGNPFCHGTREVCAHFWDVAIYIYIFVPDPSSPARVGGGGQRKWDLRGSSSQSSDDDDDACS